MAVAAVLLSACSPSAPPPPHSFVRDFAVVAHRGASAEAPENTLAAFRLAAELGADWVEVDVRMSADGVPVIVHDRSLVRTTNVEQVFPGRRPWVVSNFSVEELKRLDAGSWFAEEFAGARIPTLTELLEMASGRIGVLLHLKEPARYSGLVEEVARQLPGAGRGAAMSFSRQAIRRLHRMRPELPTGVLIASVPDEQRLGELTQVAGSVHPAGEIVNEAVVGLFHGHGLDVVPFGSGPRTDLARLLGTGLDGLITNRPAELLERLGRPHGRR